MDERAEFEKWCRSLETSPTRLAGTDQYIVPAVQSAWSAWKARANLQTGAQPVAKGLTSLLDRAEKLLLLWAGNSVDDESLPPAGVVRWMEDKEEFLASNATIQPPAALKAARDADHSIELAIALEQQRALKIVADVRRTGFAKSATNIPTQAEALFDLACEEIDNRLRTEQWALMGSPSPLPAAPEVAREERNPPLPDHGPCKVCDGKCMGHVRTSEPPSNADAGKAR